MQGLGEPVMLCGALFTVRLAPDDVDPQPLVHRCYRSQGHDAPHRCACSFSWNDDNAKGGSE